MTNVFSDPSILEDKSLTFIDMHHHSIYSDGVKKPAEILNHFKKNNKGIALTDHNQIQGAVYLDKHDILSVPGIEITAKEINPNVPEVVKPFQYNNLEPLSSQQSLF